MIFVVEKTNITNQKHNQSIPFLFSVSVSVYFLASFVAPWRDDELPLLNPGLSYTTSSPQTLLAGTFEGRWRVIVPSLSSSSAFTWA
jgi:hypothetical protein